MKPLSFCLLLGFCASRAAALTLSFDDIPPRVREHHPALKAARLAIEEARGRQLGAGRLSNPSLGLDWRPQTRLEPGSTQMAFEQAFPVTRRLKWEKQLSTQLVTAAEWEVQDVERRLVAEAREQAARLLALSGQQALRRRQMELARELTDFADSRAKAGEISPLDARQLQLDTQRLQVEARLLEAQSVSLLGRLKPLLGLRNEAPLTLAGGLPPLAIPSPSSWTQRPDYQLAQTKLAASQTDQNLAKSRQWQDVSVGLTGGPEYQTAATGDQRTGFIGFRVSIPLPFWNRNQGEIAEKAAAAERARLESEALAMQINGEAGTARKEMETNAAIVRETREQLLPLAQEQLDALQKAYETGLTDLLTLLRARDQRLQLEAAALDAARDFHLARIRYEAAVGKQASAAPAP